MIILAAAFGRLCVETPCVILNAETYTKAADFGRLCVEILEAKQGEMLKAGSRLRAAVC